MLGRGGGVNDGRDCGALERELDGGVKREPDGGVKDGRDFDSSERELGGGVKRELDGGVNDGREGVEGLTSGLVSGGRDVGGMPGREPNGDEGIAGRTSSAFLKLDPGMAGRPSAVVDGLRDGAAPLSETSGRWLPGMGRASARPKRERESDGVLPVRAAGD